ncbi:isopentenyl transferase family protein [Lentzea flava]|nr:isopentenyl transferase family protein [Lentzea flava]MCP2204775.1 Isopentenyl transferase [Lentzea flava]
MIVGTTGIGKTAAAVQLAARWNAPVVSLDRVQCFPELATTSGRPTARELAGTARLYLDNRTIAQGELTVFEAYTRLRRLLRTLSTYHPAVILEGGSISLTTLLMTGENAPPGATFELMMGDVDAPAYRARLHARVVRMLTVRPSLIDEFAHAWRYRELRGFIASIVGFDALVAWHSRRESVTSGFVLSSEDRSVLIDRITDAHLAYAREQTKSLRALENVQLACSRSLP